MGDLADMADDIQAELLTRAMRGINAAIPAGVAGECDECGEAMPRLVNGLCGFCRDGRRPPLSVFDRVPVPVQPTPKKETVAMPSLPKNTHQQTISVPAKGEVLALIRHFAEACNLPLGQAVIGLLERAKRPPQLSESAPVEPAISLADMLDSVSVEDLLGAMARRLDAIMPTPEAMAAALSRADAAEARLATIAKAIEQ